MTFGLSIAILSSTLYVAVSDISYGINMETSTSGPNGELVPSQEAYSPERKIALADLESGDNDAMLNPEDMYFDKENNIIYVADTGNNRALKIDVSDNSYVSFGKDSMNKPTGIFATDKRIYIACKGNQTLDIYDKDTLAVINTMSRPDSALFGTETPYVPSKVVASDKGDIYLVSEGCTKGILQFDEGGEFVGFVGANATSGSVSTWIQNLLGIGNTTGFLTAGAAPTNVCLDANGLVYTITQNSTSKTIKKLNTNGVSILSPSYNRSGTIQASVDDSDNIYSVQDTGSITIYDSYGNLLFTFVSNKDDEVLGSLAQPMAVQVGKDKSIYVLDKEYGMITKFAPTSFASLVYKAEDYYKDGLYLEGENSWKEVLKANSMFILAYQALAKASMKKGEYQLALEQFKKAEDKKGYSDAYWEIRNVWLQQYAGWLIIAIFSLVMAFILVKVLYKKKPLAFAGIVNLKNNVESAPVIRDAVHMKMFNFHVQDGVYETKFHHKGTILFAIILFVWFVALQILSVYLKGYLFNDQNVYNSNALQIILISTLPFLGLIISNYFVATVTDGEGKLKDCFICFVYSITPYLIWALPIFLLSRVLTYNESVIYNALMIVVYVWCGINVFLAIEELHDYGFWKTVWNIILTVFALCMFVLFCIVIYMLGYQLYNYIANIIKEATD